MHNDNNKNIYLKRFNVSKEDNKSKLPQLTKTGTNFFSIKDQFKNKKNIRPTTAGN